jgi:hypothetical protein
MVNINKYMDFRLQEDIRLESVAEEQLLEWEEKWEKAKECQI